MNGWLFVFVSVYGVLLLADKRIQIQIAVHSSSTKLLKIRLWGLNIPFDIGFQVSSTIPAFLPGRVFLPQSTMAGTDSPSQVTGVFLFPVSVTPVTGLPGGGLITPPGIRT